MLKKLSISLLILLTNITLANEQRDPHAELVKIKTHLWPSAYQNSDVKLLSRLLHDNFQLVNANGKTTQKEQELVFLSSYTWPHEDFSYTIESVTITDAKTAVIIGQGKASGSNDKGPYCFTYSSSNVLVKQGDSWQAILSHVSGYSPTCQQG